MSMGRCGINIGRLARQTFAAVITAGVISGCESLPVDGDGEAGYTLQVILEKNLDVQRDYLWVRFQRDDAGIPGGLVVVDGDTVTTEVSTGEGSRTYVGGRWGHRAEVLISAIDTSQTFIHRDSVRIPGPLTITNVIPVNRLWTGGPATLEWSPAADVTAYAVTITPRTPGSSARGLAEHAPLGETSYTCTPEVFKNTLDQTIPGIYDIRVIAYAPNFLPRSGAIYKLPVSDVPSPINEKAISGALAALVVSVHDSLEVPEGQ